MFDIDSRDGSTPTRRLRALLTWQPHITGTTYADLILYPVVDIDTSKNRWYDVWYTHRTVDENGDVTHKKIRKALTLPAPPVIPVEERLAAAPEPTLDGWTEEKIRMVGGREAALEHVRRHQTTQIRHDRTVDIYDWEQAAQRYTQMLDTIEPLKLTAAQRAHVGRARLATAQDEVASAKASLIRLEANARRAKATTHDPAPEAAPAGPGRPSTGDPVKVNIPTEHIAALDTLARSVGQSRADLIRDAVAAYLR